MCSSDLKPAKATVVNLGVSFLHLSVTEKTEKPIEDVSPNTKPIKDFSPVLPIAIINIPTVIIVFVSGTSLIPNNGNHTQNIPPGAMSGPFLCSIFMEITGLNGYFIFLMFFHLLIGIYGIYRSRIRPAVENPDSQFIAMPQSITY